MCIRYPLILIIISFIAIISLSSCNDENDPVYILELQGDCKHRTLFTAGLAISNNLEYEIVYGHTTNGTSPPIAHVQTKVKIWGSWYYMELRHAYHAVGLIPEEDILDSFTPSQTVGPFTIEKFTAYLYRWREL